MIIYKIIFPNNKCYIGQTIKTLKERKREHLSELQRSDFKVYRAIKKYGWNNLKWETIEFFENIDHFLLDEREIYWIKYFDSFRNGYNSTIGGMGSSGYKPNKNQIKQMSERFKGNKNPTKRKDVKEKIKMSWTEERRRKQSEIMKGNKISGDKGKWSEERKNTFSNYMFNKCKNDKEYLKKRTKKLREKMKKPEMIKKIKELRKGIKNPNFKYEFIFEKENVILSTKGQTLSEFCQHNNLNYKSIDVTFQKKKCQIIYYKGWKIEKRRINEK